MQCIDCVLQLEIQIWWYFSLSWFSSRSANDVRIRDNIAEVWDIINHSDAKNGGRCLCRALCWEPVKFKTLMFMLYKFLSRISAFTSLISYLIFWHNLTKVFPPRYSYKCKGLTSIGWLFWFVLKCVEPGILSYCGSFLKLKYSYAGSFGHRLDGVEISDGRGREHQIIQNLKTQIYSPPSPPFFIVSDTASNSIVVPR